MYQPLRTKSVIDSFSELAAIGASRNKIADSIIFRIFVFIVTLKFEKNCPRIFSWQGGVIQKAWLIELV